MNEADKKKNVVVIGGGHGTGVVLSSLSDSGFALYAVVSMADDGGSTGRLRKELGVSAAGDIRQCLARLSSDKNGAELFNHRFEGGDLDGHTLGNLFLAGAEVSTGNLIKSIGMAKKMLGVSADILPATEDKPYLQLETDGKTLTGVHNIANIDIDARQAKLYLQPESPLSPAANDALEKADLILIAPGNFYCSIMPALLVGGMAQAINSSKARSVYIANLVNRQNHTKDYAVADYIDEINRLAGSISIDTVLYNTAEIRPDCLREGEQPVGFREEGDTSYQAIGRDLADDEPVPVAAGDKIAAVRSLVRHDRTGLAEAIKEIAAAV